MTSRYTPLRNNAIHVDGESVVDKSSGAVRSPAEYA